MPTGLPKSSEVIPPRSAFGFVRPLPTARTDETAAEATRLVSVPRERDRWDRLFPSTAGLNEPGSSYQVNGLQFGNYIIQERIGRGGMGAVFRAVDIRLDRVVALKVLAPEYTRDPASVQRFQNEARAAAKLDHDTIARVFSSGEDSGQQYIAFEYVAGTNLREMIQNRGSLTVPETVSILLQMADALRYTSAANVVHRDIKPSNIIVTAAGRAKLVDLGLARQTQLPGEELTVHGTTLGTFDYISPEQSVDPRNVDVRSDIYSLGCTAYHMLTGEPPYPQGTMIQKVMDHHAMKMPDPQAKNPLVPLVLSRIIQKMMASQVEARYQRPEDLIRDLTPLAQAYGIAIRPGELNSPSTTRWSWSEFRGWILAAGILLAVGVLASWPPTEPQPTSSPERPAMELAAVAAIPPAAEAHRAATGGGTNDSPSESPAVDHSVVGGFKSGAIWGNNNVSAAPVLGQLATVGSSGSRMTSEGPSPTASPPIEENRFWIAESALGEAHGDQEKSYPTLEAACLDAPDNSTIELRYDGAAPPQRPIRIEGKSLRIRAESGRRPTLTFEAPGVVGLSVTPQMITVTSGGLTLFDIDLIFRVPRGRAANRWSLFSLQHAKNLTLRGVSVTLENAQRQQPATVFEIRSASATGTDRLMPDGMMKGPIQIQISQSIFRGEADGFRMDESIELQVDMSHVAWGLAGVLIGIDTRERVQMATMSEPVAVRVVLNNVTAVLENGLAQMTAGEALSAPVLRVESENSLISMLRADQALVTMSGPLEMRDWQERLHWQGSHNYLDVTGSWWEISAQRSLSMPNRRYNAADWDLQWNSMGGTIIDRNVYESSEPWENAVFHEIEAEAFHLYSQPGVYKAPEGADGRHAGIDWSQPRLPKRFPDL
ncbi:MAG: serine/threonine protein kinase [Planctomycetota bacterium]|nr:MAG: serine/threonine protein kinase [Planctomycetota bacterium]